ncbi:MAG: DUF11 domain-containing protein [Saprospiraceae bacterium]|nr:DUF11 domain-containing protein [Saprospiraceae bacterium]
MTLEIVDYIPCGFEYVSGSQAWSVGSNQATTVCAGLLTPGQSKTMRIDLRVIPCATPNAWTNYAEVRAMEDESGVNIGSQDIDSTPDNNNGNDDGGTPDSANDDYVDGNGKSAGGAPGDNGTATDEDDHDPELVPVFDLALTKVLNTAAPYTYGQTHNFTITVYNQGNVTATNILLNDYIPAGYTFATNNGWTGSAPTITRTIAGPLAPGASTTVSLDLTFVRIVTPTTGKSWVNYAEIASGTRRSGISGI